METNIKFAKLVSFVTKLSQIELSEVEIQQLADLTKYHLSDADAVDVKSLLLAMADDRLIDAIKLYRQLTGSGLKESKEAVEAGMHKGPLSSSPKM